MLEHTPSNPETGTGAPRAATAARADRPTVAESEHGLPHSFEEIYARFRAPILAYVSGRISDPSDRDELTQEIFLKVHRFRDDYDPRFGFSTWLWTIARNTIHDWLRKHRAAIECGLRAGECGNEAEELPCTRMNAETLVLEMSQRRALIRTFRHLTRQQRRVLWLRVVHQRSYAEISRQLGLSLSAAKNLSLRARSRLAEVLGCNPRFA